MAHRMMGVAMAAALLAPAVAPAQSRPDPLARLSEAISAVLDVGDAPRVLIVESAYGVSNTRTLAVGDVYRDGWRVTALDAQAITLGKDGVSRRIAIPSQFRTAEAERSAPFTPVGAFASSNATGGERAGRIMSRVPAAPGFMPVPGPNGGMALGLPQSMQIDPGFAGDMLARLAEQSGANEISVEVMEDGARRITGTAPGGGGEFSAVIRPDGTVLVGSGAVPSSPADAR